MADLTVSAIEVTGCPTKTNATELFALGMSDAALFHAFLQHWARHLNFLTGNTKSLEHDFHKMKSIQLVNARLQNLTDGISVPIILTVACLAHIGVSLSLSIIFDDLSNISLVNSTCCETMQPGLSI